MTLINYRTLILSACIWLGACASTTQTPFPATIPTENDSITHWQAEGKIAFRAENKSQSANFIWENADDNYKIQLFGPFGQGRVTIEKSGTVIELQHDGETHRATSAQALLEQTTGISLPVHWLSFWIKGLPAPNSAFDNPLISENQQLQSFEQDDWHVLYTQFTRTSGFTLPNKMKFRQDNYRLSVAVKSWQIP